MTAKMKHTYAKAIPCTFMYTLKNKFFSARCTAGEKNVQRTNQCRMKLHHLLDQEVSRTKAVCNCLTAKHHSVLIKHDLQNSKGFYHKKL
ncbi:hypothetical protein XELAEV_18041814mg [Xenopus laevis]|uniref:Uncharacterized protein n=1 Tax=Xenopus laevis TaxID=8355 RepID=A0A974C341_XENLA|nr:hypothetical protein XELAEV_18041814mg [Xenopus laevis]